MKRVNLKPCVIKSQSKKPVSEAVLRMKVHATSPRLLELGMYVNKENFTSKVHREIKDGSIGTWPEFV